MLALGVSPHQHTVGIPEFKYVGNMHGNEVRQYTHMHTHTHTEECHSLLTGSRTKGGQKRSTKAIQSPEPVDSFVCGQQSV